MDDGCGRRLGLSSFSHQKDQEHGLIRALRLTSSKLPSSFDEGRSGGGGISAPSPSAVPKQRGAGNEDEKIFLPGGFSTSLTRRTREIERRGGRSDGKECE